MSMTSRIGLAIFVKTPGHSPLKTRLAATIGAQAASEFHMLSADAVAAVAQATQAVLPSLAPHWAVAEPEALDDPAWSLLPRIEQGQGDLGARMRHVVDALCASHGGALLLGADTPQIEVRDLHAAAEALQAHEHVLGPSEDGGFWLFATRSGVSPHAWSSTPWSQADTATRFSDALGDTSVARLRTLRDVDSGADLAPVLAALESLTDPLPEQLRLAGWLRELPL